MRNKILIGLVMVLVVVGMFGVVSAELNMSDSLTYQRYQLVLNEFDKGKEFVPISVNVFSEEQREAVIFSLSGEGFRNLRRELPYSFSCEVTISELAKLSNHSDVKWINLQEVISTQDNETIRNDTVQDEIKKRDTRYNWLYWLGGIVIILIIIWMIFNLISYRKKQ